MSKIRLNNHSLQTLTELLSVVDRLESKYNLELYQVITYSNIKYPDLVVLRFLAKDIKYSLQLNYTPILSADFENRIECELTSYNVEEKEWVTLYDGDRFEHLEKIISAL